MITAQQELLLDLLYQDGLPVDIVERVKEIKEQAGYAPTTNAYQILRPLKDALVERNLEYMILDSNKSIKALQDIVRTPTEPGSDTKLKASNSILDRTGYAKKEIQEIEAKEFKGIVILPAKTE